jgi:hypothetical protein
VITLITSIEFREMPRQEPSLAEEPAPWRSRQQLRALYFSQEQEGIEEVPTERRVGVVRLTIVAAKWRTADVAG